MISMIITDVYRKMKELSFALAFREVLRESLFREPDIASLPDRKGIAWRIPVHVALTHLEAFGYLVSSQEPIRVERGGFACPDGHSQPQ
jgi:hypothetical protein